MKKTFIFLTILLTSFVSFSCATVKEIPEDKTPAQILQMGQNASAAGSLSSAELCFNTILERFSDNPKVVVEATYELGHIYYKQKKYDEAEKCFNKVLNMFKQEPYNLDFSFKKLCEIGLSNIEKARNR